MSTSKDKTLKTLKQIKEEAAFYEKVKIVAAIALLGAGGFFVGRKLYNDSIYNEILKWICEDFLNFQTEEECEKCKEKYNDILKDKTQKEINEIHKIIKTRAISFENDAREICKDDIYKTYKDCKQNSDYKTALRFHRNELAIDLLKIGIILPKELNSLEAFTVHSIREF